MTANSLTRVNSIADRMETAPRVHFVIGILLLRLTSHIIKARKECVNEGKVHAHVSELLGDLYGPLMRYVNPLDHTGTFAPGLVIQHEPQHKNKGTVSLKLRLGIYHGLAG